MWLQNDQAVKDSALRPHEGGRTQFSCTYALFVVIFKPLPIGRPKLARYKFNLKRLYFNMFYWTKYRCHDNTAVNKPAIKNGFDLFSENSVVRFFPSFVSKNFRRTLAY